jgi:beta-lactam-binding protein with PASTA domain
MKKNKNSYSWVLEHFALASFVALAVVVSVLFFLSSYTRQDQAIPLPNWVGLPLQEALVNQGGFRLIVMDSVFFPERKKGEVVRQIPSAMYKDPVTGEFKRRAVKEGREIQLVINKFKAPTVQMPNYYARPIKEVRMLLTERNIFIKQEVKILAELCSDCVSSVLDKRGQKINPGDYLNEKDTVMVYVDASKAKKSLLIDLPLLEGMSLEEAREALSVARLNLGKVKDLTQNPAYTPVVKSQNPNPKNRAQVSVGAYVDVVLGKP